VFAATRDITEQKKLEQQLRKQQSYLRGLIESSVDGLIMVEPLGTVTDVNQRMCEMIEYARSALIGSPVADYFTDPERASAGVQQTSTSSSILPDGLAVKLRPEQHEYLPAVLRNSPQFSAVVEDLPTVSRAGQWQLPIQLQPQGSCIPSEAS